MFKKIRLVTLIAILALAVVTPLLVGCPGTGTNNPGNPSSPWIPF